MTWSGHRENLLCLTLIEVGCTQHQDKAYTKAGNVDWTSRKPETDTDRALVCPKC